MTCAAPRERTSSTLRVLHTPVTSAPNALAICTANVPTPPDAPVTSTVCPGCTCAMSRRACSAVIPDVGTVAACSIVSLSGLRTSWSAGTDAYCASVPAVLQPNTSSPGWRSVTAAPTASTTPARSLPGMGWRGRRRPNASRTMLGTPVITK